MPQDKPGVGVSEPPPPPAPVPLILSGIALALNAATLAALLADRCSLATILAGLGLLFGGAAFIMLMRANQDKPGVGVSEPPPRG
jgi:hypothetical protein